MKTARKTHYFYILVAFFLITVESLIAGSSYSYLIKYWAKWKHLVPFHDINNELKQVLYWQYKWKRETKSKI